MDRTSKQIFSYLTGTTLEVVLKDVMHLVNGSKDFLRENHESLSEKQKKKITDELQKILITFKPGFQIYLDNFVANKKIKEFANFWCLYEKEK